MSYDRRKRKEEEKRVDSHKSYGKKITDDLLKSNEYVGKTTQELLNDGNLYNEVAELVVFEAALLGIDVKKIDDGEHMSMYVY